MPEIRIKKFDGGETDHYLDVHDPSYSERMENVVIDADGKVLSREGYEHIAPSLRQIAAGSASVRTLAVTESYGFGGDTDLGTHNLSIHYSSKIQIVSIAAGRLEDFDRNHTYRGERAQALYAYNPNPGLHTLQGVTHDTDADPRGFASNSALKMMVSDTNQGAVYTFDSLSPPIIWPERIATASLIYYYYIGLPKPKIDGIFFDTGEISLYDDGTKFSYIWYVHAFYSYTLDNGEIYTISGPVTQYSFTYNEPLDASNKWQAPDGFILDEKIYEGITPGSPEYPTVKFAVYRTFANSTQSHFVETLDIGEAFASDTKDDAALFATEPTDGLPAQCYIDGGVLDNDAPDPGKYNVFANGVLWIGHLEKTPNRVIYSKSNQPHAFPGSFFVDLDSKITGMAAVREFPIVFTDTAVYRFEGISTDTGAGQPLPKLISRKTGCHAPHSIVKVGEAVFWFGGDGIYSTDGYKVNKVTVGLDEAMLAKLFPYATGEEDRDYRPNRVVGTYNQTQQRIYWTFAKDNALDTDSILCLELKGKPRVTKYFAKPGRPDNFIGGGRTYTPVSVAAFSDFLLVGSYRGGLFAHKRYLTDDIILDDDDEGTAVGVHAVLYDWITASMAFGGEFSRKWVTSLVIRCKNFLWRRTEPVQKQIQPTAQHSTLSMQISSINDDDKSGERDLAPIVEPVTDTDLRVIRRRFPSGGLRCHDKQLRFRRALVTFADSAADGLALCDLIGGSLALQSGDFSQFVTVTEDLKNHYVLTSLDNYTTGYQIKSAIGAGDTILTYTPIPDADTTDLHWRIVGYPKNEKVRVESLQVEWVDLGESAEDAGD